MRVRKVRYEAHEEGKGRGIRDAEKKSPKMIEMGARGKIKFLEKKLERTSSKSESVLFKLVILKYKFSGVIGVLASGAAA